MLKFWTCYAAFDGRSNVLQACFKLSLFHVCNIHRCVIGACTHACVCLELNDVQ